jgi:uncharacterized membrane protein
MKNVLITYSELINFSANQLRDISTYSLSMWLKAKTDNQFVVIERAFIIEAIKYIELNKHTDGFIGHDLKERWNLEIIKDYI